MKLRDLFEDQRSLAEALKDCEPYLNLPGAKHGMLFRGLRGGSLESYILDKQTGLRWKNMKTRRDRIPADTPARYSKLADDVLHAEFGWYPRSEGTFATGSIKDTHEYGIPHIMIPIGPTRFVWSPKVKDLYVSLFQNLSSPLFRAPDEESGLMWTDAVAAAGYKDTDLGAAIRSFNEIMLDCDRYLAIRCEGGESSVMAAVYKLTDIEPDYD